MLNTKLDNALGGTEESQIKKEMAKLDMNDKNKQIGGKKNDALNQEYYEKYLKYKAKYNKLKNSLLG